MKASKQDLLTRPFVLTPEDITKLLSQMLPFLPTVRISAECADGVKRAFTNENELLSYENSKRQQIERLIVFAASEDAKDTALVRFSRSKKNNVGVIIDAEEHVLTTLSQAVETRLEAMRPWYYLIARIDFVYVLSGLLCLNALLALGYGLLARGTQIFGEINSTLVGPAVVGILIGVLPFPVGLILNKLGWYVFPTGVFAIGHGIKRAENAHIFRTVVVVAFIVSIAASVVTALLSH